MKTAKNEGSTTETQEPKNQVNGETETPKSYMLEKIDKKTGKLVLAPKFRGGNGICVEYRGYANEGNFKELDYTDEPINTYKELSIRPLAWQIVEGDIFGDKYKGYRWLEIMFLDRKDRVSMILVHQSPLQNNGSIHDFEKLAEKLLKAKTVFDMDFGDIFDVEIILKWEKITAPVTKDVVVDGKIVSKTEDQNWYVMDFSQFDVIKEEEKAEIEAWKNDYEVKFFSPKIDRTRVSVIASANYFDTTEMILEKNRLEKISESTKKLIERFELRYNEYKTVDEFKGAIEKLRAYVPDETVFQERKADIEVLVSNWIQKFEDRMNEIANGKKEADLPI